MIGALIQILVLLIVLGVIWWAINRILGVIPLEEPFRTLVNVVLVVIVVIIAIYILLQLLGIAGVGVPKFSLLR